MAVFKRPVRPRSLRVFLIGMFAVPLVSLLALWGFASLLTIPGAVSNHTYSANEAAFQDPAFTALGDDLPAEQEQTYVWQLSGGKYSKTSLNADRAKITAAIPSVVQTVLTSDTSQSAASKADADALIAELKNLPAIRQSVDNGTMPAAQAFQAYNDIINDQYQMYYSETVDQGGSLQSGSVAAVDAGVATDRASQELTLVDGALAFNRAQMSAASRQLFISAAAQREDLMSQSLSLMTPETRDLYLAVENSAPYKQFESMQDKIMNGTGTLPVSFNTWNTDASDVLTSMLAAETTGGHLLGQQSSAASDDLVTKAVLAGGVGLAAVVVSVILMLWFGRKVTRDLGKLDGSVRGMAEERLPRVVDALRRGDDVDVRAESPTPPSSTIEEVSRIGRSFGIVQEAAVAAAVEQARLRKGVNQVFLNISMRNQSLLHRQLGMLDSMERRTSDPGALSDLFRLDHLTTRMRRHAEGLIILSGSTPGRAWRDPVPVVDVLRAAIAEVEDYVRVDVLSESRDLVAGNAVNDIIHLVAELVENAAVFSPPNTRIEVRADRAGTGLVAEIEDRGLGIGMDELADINRRLASPPDFDPAASEQLGLFVVSRLAARHSIRVSLRQSVYGGTTAILVIPFGVIVREEETVPPTRNDEWSISGGQQLTRRPAGADDDQAGSSRSPLGGNGRHRVATAPTGRRMEVGDEELNGTEAPRSRPRAPWEFAQAAASAAAPAREPEQATSWIPAPVQQLAPPPTGPARSEVQLGSASAMPPTDPYGQASPYSQSASYSQPSQPSSYSQPSQAANPYGQNSHLGMPVRVPQASLAPQLRKQQEAEQRAEAREVPAVDVRSPETTRNMMIMMQQGWERGRMDDVNDFPDADDYGSEG
jgi:signal transduction histidine kinase